MIQNFLTALKLPRWRWALVGAVVVTLAGTETQRLPDDPGTVGHGAGPIQKP